MFTSSFSSFLRSYRYLNSGDHAKRVLKALIRRLIDYRAALIDPFLRVSRRLAAVRSEDGGSRRRGSLLLRVYRTAVDTQHLDAPYQMRWMRDTPSIDKGNLKRQSFPFFA